MDERRYERSASFARMVTHIGILSDRLAEIPLEELKPYRAAAEEPKKQRKRAACKQAAQV
jgi:hypothetical protein